MKTIVLDTNFLLIPLQFGVDIFTQINDVVTESHKIAILDFGSQLVNYMIVDFRKISHIQLNTGIKLVWILSVYQIKQLERSPKNRTINREKKSPNCDR